MTDDVIDCKVCYGSGECQECEGTGSVPVCSFANYDEFTVCENSNMQSMKITRYTQGFHKFGMMEQCKDGEWMKVEDFLEYKGEVEKALDISTRNLELEKSSKNRSISKANRLQEELTKSHDNNINLRMWIISACFALVSTLAYIFHKTCGG